MKRYTPAKGEKFTVLFVRPAFSGRTFVSEGEIIGNRLKAHIEGQKGKIIVMLDLAQFTFKPCR